MNSRERVLTALQHKEADRVPLDLGAMLSTGISGMAYNELKSYLGIRDGRTRMYDLGQQLAEPETEILERIGDLAPGGGFVFTQVHNIQVGVPPENIMAMYDAVREFGAY